MSRHFCYSDCLERRRRLWSRADEMIEGFFQDEADYPSLPLVRYRWTGQLLDRSRMAYELGKVLSDDPSLAEDAAKWAERARDELKKLANHLRRYRDEWLTFLYVPEAPPTNNLAERQLRPCVVSRKIGGCNKSLKGALTHYVLMSVMVTWRQRSLDFLEFATQLWRSREPLVVPLRE